MGSLSVPVAPQLDDGAVRRRDERTEFAPGLDNMRRPETGDDVIAMSHSARRPNPLDARRGAN